MNYENTTGTASVVEDEICIKFEYSDRSALSFKMIPAEARNLIVELQNAVEQYQKDQDIEHLRKISSSSVTAAMRLEKLTGEKQTQWKELSREEVMGSSCVLPPKITSILPLKEIYKRFLGYSDEEADKLIAAKKLEKIEDMKLRIMEKNPELLS